MRAPGGVAEEVGWRPGKWSTGSMLLGGVAAGVVIIALANTADIDQPGLRATLACWTSVPYIVTGAVAWRRRPDSKLGPWMVVTGFVAFLTFLNWSQSELLFTVSTATQFAPPLLFLVVFLTYPTGRFRSVADRTVIGIAAAAAALTFVYMPLGYEETLLAPPASSPEPAQRLHDIQLLAMSAALLAGSILLIVRRIGGRRPLRPWLGYLITSFAAVLAMLAVLYLVQYTGWGLVTEPVRLTTFGLIGVAPIVFLYGLLHERLGRASVAELMALGSRSPDPAELEAGVARALRDQSARVLYWIPEFESYADIDGRSVDPDQAPGMSASPVTRDEDPVALILHDQALDHEPTLLASVVSATGMLIQKARLEVELRARVEELRGSRIRILEAEQRERRRLERNLHDGAQQRLLALSLTLGEIETHLEHDPELRRRVDSARGEVAESLRELRDLAHGIHPAAIIDHGLAVALESVATRAPLPVELTVTELTGVPKAAEVTAYYLVCEAISNIGKHADASAASIDVRVDEGRMAVVVRDDGVGGADPRSGSGLRGLADRVEASGGRFRVWSPPGKGTTIEAHIPCV